MKKYFAVIVLFLALFTQCKKKDEPVFSEVPEISLVDMTPPIAKEFKDSVNITIHYQDGDGDLGFEESDSFALFVKDIRLTEYDKFFVAPLAPLDAVIPITGTLTIPFGKMFRLGTQPTETTRFRIKIRDRKGNWSNEIETEDITILQ